jgi:hypothetical protein
MSELFELSVIIRPGIYPADRHAIEDELEEVFAEDDLGEINGGGTAVDLSYCDMDITVTDLDAGLRVIREVLKRHEVPPTSVIIHHGAERVEYPVYE